MLVRKKYIQSIIEGLIETYNLQPSKPVNVSKIVENMGIEIVLEPTDDELSGFLLVNKQNRGSVIIGVNKNHSSSRRRFTIAHELGHYLLHNYEGLHYDGPNVGYRVKRRDSNSSTGSNFEEREANLFAAELLMPARFIHDELQDVDAVEVGEGSSFLNKLAKKYGVSQQAMMIRLINLGYID